jgi:glycosyltransferase involved in cell wall biosynthesis
VPKISVTVITKNEAADIADALASVAWADEIVVVDSESTDDTVAIAKRLATHVVVRPWEGYVAQKNAAAALASHDWILSLDADERVTPALADEMRALGADPPHAAYRMPRVTWHLDRWVRTTDWYPDRQLRFYDRRRARWTGRRVHEGVHASGSVGDLRGELQHYAYRDVADHLETIERYTTLASEQMLEDGRHSTLMHLALHPPLAFLRNYIARGGIRDGRTGLIISALNAYYVYKKYAKLRELRQQRRRSHLLPRTSHRKPRT